MGEHATDENNDTNNNNFSFLISLVTLNNSYRCYVYIYLYIDKNYDIINHNNNNKKLKNGDAKITKVPQGVLSIVNSNNEERARLYKITTKFI